MERKDVTMEDTEEMMGRLFPTMPSRITASNGDYPFTPCIHIVLNSFSTDSDGSVSLSAQLMTDQEIDYRIQSLKDDLDRIGHAAKQARRRAHDEPLNLSD